MSLLSGAVARAATPPDCCGALAYNVGPNRVFGPGQAPYNSTQASFWSLQESSLHPRCIVIPQDEYDISNTMFVLAYNSGCHFAVKGNGHAPAPGFANINGPGVTVDMTALKNVAVSKDRTVAHIGAGASWLHVYNYLAPLGLVVPGGRNGMVGVGGLTLGGGISYLFPRVGWSCDNVVNFQIATPKNGIVNANATSNPDLFRALKGGWNNFGLVTRIDMRTVPQGQILGGSLTQNISQREAVFNAFADIAAAPEYDPYASIVAGLLFDSSTKSWTLSETPIYTKPVKKPAVYKTLIDIPTTVNNLKLTTLDKLANEAATPPLNWLFLTGTYAASATVLSETFDIANSTIYNFNPSDGVIWSIAFEPLPTIATKFGSRKGNKNSLGTSPKDGNAIVLLISALWPNSAVNKAVNAKAEALLSKIDAAMEAKGLLHTFQYINYAGPSQDPIGSYGKSNVELLKRVSKQYDPTGVFQKQVPGGFKLF